MKYILLLVSFTGIIISLGVEAAPLKIDCDMKSYECYQKHVEDICNAKDVPWGSGPDLGALKSLTQCKDYPESSTGKINAAISCMQGLEQSDPTSLKDGVSLSSIGGSNTFRIAEVARLMYRRNMNSIFACGIIASRSAKLDALYTSLNGKQGASEIQKSIEKERKKYSNLRTEMVCDQNRPENNSKGITERVMKSSMKEYCRYTYYLDYIETNVRENFAATSLTEAKIGDGNTSKAAQNSDSARKELGSRSQIIQQERSRANDVLPKAIVAFQEMDRTYIVHIMLTFIYDDYLRLRNQLNSYLTTVGQTFEKAFNAQDNNQK